MADVDPGDARWATTLRAWASDAQCAEIRQDESHEFARIWMACFVVGIIAFALSAVPYFWCESWRERDDVGEELADLEKTADADGNDASDLGSTAASLSATARRVSVEGAVSKQPDLEAARRHLLETSVTDALGQWRSVWGTKLTSMGQIGGTGLELYFRMLRVLGFCFCYMATWTTPIWVFSLEGNFVPDVGSFTARTTIGNLGMIARAGIPQELRQVVVGCQSIDMKKLTAVFGWLDFVAIVIYVFFVAYFRFRIIPQVREECDAASVTCSDYAVTIDCLPAQLEEEEHENYEQHVREHVATMVSMGNVAKKMKKKGLFSSTHTEASREEEQKKVQVPEVSLVRDYGKRLSSLKDRAQMIVDKEVAEYHGDDKTAETLETRLQQTKEKLSKHLKPEVELPVVKAFVLMNSTQDRDTLMNMYRWANFRIFRCKFCVHRFRGTHAIRVRQAPEPSNIYWQNQDVPAFERRVRKVVMFSFWLMIMSLSTVVIWYCSHVAQQEGGNPGAQSLGSETCDAGTRGATAGDAGVEATCNALEAMTWTLDYALNLTAAADIDCFCVTKGYSTIVQSAEMRDLCYDWLVAAARSMGVGVMSSLVVVVVNTVLKMSVTLFSEQEKPASITDQNGSIMIKVFVSQFINTIAIVWLLNSSILSMFGEDFGGQYDGFERGWYASVGGPLVVTVGVNAVTASVTYLSTLGMQGFTQTFQRRHQGLYIHGDDCPGPYVLTLGSGNLTAVTADMSQSSDLVGHLAKNTPLEIKEVQTLVDEHLVRGRIEEAGPLELSGWVSLCSTTDGYRWVAKVQKSCCKEKVVKGPDSPGSYKVVHGGNALTTVTEGSSELSKSVGALSRNSKVEVLGIETQEDEKRIRGRIEGKVPGWITLLETDTGLRRAFHAKKSPVGALAVKHQAELIVQYTNPPFDMASRYAQILTMCYITLVFSAGLPIVNWLAALFCFVTYWSDKTVLLRGSYRPPAYDTQMAYQASQLCLYAVPMHLIAAIWMYSHPCIFPSNPLGGELAGLAGNLTNLAANITLASNATSNTSSGGNDIGSLLASDQLVSADGFLDRITRESTWMIFILLAIFLVLVLVQVVTFVVGSALGDVFNLVKMACCRSSTPPAKEEGKDVEEDEEAVEQADFMLWPEAMAYIESVTKFPATYRLDLNREWRPLFRAMKAEARRQEESLAGTMESSDSRTDGDLRQAADASGSVDAEPAESDASLIMVEPAPADVLPPLVLDPATEQKIDPERAQLFINALRREYVEGSGAAVGDFLDEIAGLHSDDMEEEEFACMSALEVQVRAAPDKKAAIEALAARWQVLFVQDA